MNHIYTHLPSENHIDDKVVATIRLTLAYRPIVSPDCAVDTSCA